MAERGLPAAFADASIEPVHGASDVGDVRVAEVDEVLGCQPRAELLVFKVCEDFGVDNAPVAIISTGTRQVAFPAQPLGCLKLRQRDECMSFVRSSDTRFWFRFATRLNLLRGVNGYAESAVIEVWIVAGADAIFQ